MLIIGVVGQPSSGKDTISEYLVTKGFRHISSSDWIRAEMRVLGLTVERENMHKFVSQKREEQGNQYPMQSIAEAINGDTVVSGFRNTAEINFLKGKFSGNFHLIAVEAPLERRYEWAKARGRIGDDISFEQFKKEEDAERNKSSAYEVDNVVKMADFLVSNEGTKEELLQKIDDIMAEW